MHIQIISPIRWVGCSTFSLLGESLIILFPERLPADHRANTLPALLIIEFVFMVMREYMRVKKVMHRARIWGQPPFMIACIQETGTVTIDLFGMLYNIENMPRRIRKIVTVSIFPWVRFLVGACNLSFLCGDKPIVDKKTFTNYH